MKENNTSARVGGVTANSNKSKPNGSSRNSKGYLIQSSHFRNCSVENPKMSMKQSLKVSVTLDEASLAQNQLNKTQTSVTL